MQRSKSRLELLSVMYLNTSEIARLLDIPRPRAKRIFDIAMHEDKAQLGTRQIYDTKVRLKTVMAVAGINYNLLSKQIKSASILQDGALSEHA